MSRRITDIYQQYKIVPTLQMHMLRVAAVASMICDNLDTVVDKDSIISACLIHDMGNIVKSDFVTFPDFWLPEGVEYWQNVKQDFVERYGANDHEANMNISKDLGVTEKVTSLVDSYHFALLCKHAQDEDMEIKIAHYCDGRVGPHGVLSFHNRMAEASRRYKRDDEEKERNKDILIDCGKDIEKQIFARCQIKPEDINDDSVLPIIEKLKGFVLI